MSSVQRGLYVIFGRLGGGRFFDVVCVWGGAVGPVLWDEGGFVVLWERRCPRAVGRKKFGGRNGGELCEDCGGTSVEKRKNRSLYIRPPQRNGTFLA